MCFRLGFFSYGVVPRRFLVGEADYCTSPSITQSAFSKTAIARGDCLYINYEDGAQCSITNAVSNKEYLLYPKRGNGGDDLLENVLSNKNALTKEEIWESVVFSREKVYQQCVDSDAPKDFIFEYWKAPSN